MKAIINIFCLVVALLFSCHSNNDGAASDNDMDAVRNFLDAALKGNFQDASHYMLQDSTNDIYLDMAERIYKGKPTTEKDSLKSSSLHFFDTKQLNDSTTVTIFANSYKNKKDTLKVVRKNGQWLVDLKYLFDHGADTTTYKQKNKIDTIQK